jgi:AraC family transcriptional regulator|tara:strand:- start:217041 stop:217703 length:663 start_codon:yes stop_codon:yes gene_type:complete
MIAMGKLMFVPAGASISATGPGGDRHLSVCTMPEGFLPANFDPADQRFLAMCGDVRDTNIWSAMQRLSSEASCPGFGSDILVDGLATALQVDIRRYFEAAKVRLKQYTGTLASWQLKRIEEFVYAAEGQRVRIADLASIAEVSPGHLVRTFKRTTGRTVHQFVEEVRLQRACMLLRSGNQPLKQIAATLGFSSTSSFSLAFRKSMGTTPGRFRSEQPVLN